VPVVTLVAVALSALVAGYATASTDKDTGPAFVEPSPTAAAQEMVWGLVLRQSGDTLTISVGGNERSFRLQPDTVIEQIQPGDLAGLKVGDWLNGVALPHAQTILTLTAVVVIPQSQLGSR